MAYKITFTASEEIVGNLKRKGLYPFVKGGHSFEVGTEITVEDITPFLADPRLPKPKDGNYIIDSRLSYEEVHGDLSEAEDRTV